MRQLVLGRFSCPVLLTTAFPGLDKLWLSECTLRLCLLVLIAIKVLGNPVHSRIGHLSCGSMA